MNGEDNSLGVSKLQVVNCANLRLQGKILFLASEKQEAH
jgi:hypothetical protein